MTDSTRNDAAAEALHALVARSTSTSGLDEPALGDEPRAIDPAASSERAANSAEVHCGTSATPFSKIPRLPDSDDGEARMPANRMRPPALGSRVMQFIEPRAPKPVLVKSVNGNGVAVVDEIVEPSAAAEAIAEESKTPSDAADESPQQTAVVSDAPTSDEATRESPDVVSEEPPKDESRAIDPPPPVEEPEPSAEPGPELSPPPQVLEGEVIDVAVEPVTEPSAELIEPPRDNKVDVIDVIPIPASEPASVDAQLPTSLLDLDAPAFATFVPPAPIAPDTAIDEPAAPSPQQVDVRKISPEDAPAPIDVQRPLAPSRRTPVVPIFADASAGNATSSAPASAPSSTSTDPVGGRGAFTIAELAADSIAPVQNMATAPAALPSAPSMPLSDVSLTDLAAAVHGDAGTGANASRADDVTMVPAPTTEVFARSSARSGKLVAQQSVAFRRTIIPILLTLGLIAIALGGGWFALPPDSGLRGDGPGIAVALLCTGPILLGLAALNMLQVRSMLRPLVRSR